MVPGWNIPGSTYDVLPPVRRDKVERRRGRTTEDGAARRYLLDAAAHQLASIK